MHILNHASTSLMMRFYALMEDRIRVCTAAARNPLKH